MMRDALERFAQEQEEPGSSALDRLKSFVGVADSGGQQLSTKTGQRFREKVVEKQRARRSG